MPMSEHDRDLLFEEIRASIRDLDERMKQFEDGQAQPPGPKVDSDTPKDQVPLSNILGFAGPEMDFRPPTHIIPQLKYLGWHEFKNKLANEKAYAIEILVGEAKLYHQRAEEEQKNNTKGAMPGHDQRAKRPLVLGAPVRALEFSTPKEVPERIRINSTPLLMILQQIDPEPLWSIPTVMLRPYKFLVHYDAQLREKYHRLEAKWGASESGICLGHLEPPVPNVGDQVCDKTKTNELLNSPLTAKEWESSQNPTAKPSTAQSENAFGHGSGLSTEVSAEVEEDRCLNAPLLRAHLTVPSK